MDCKMFYQSLVLFAFYRFGLCQIFQYELPVQFAYTSVDGSEKEWVTVRISKYKYSDRFVFSPDELNDLCSGIFVPKNVEILELVDQEMSFVILRKGPNFPLYVRVVFTLKKDMNTFFKDIRSPKRQLYGVGIHVDSILKYPKENVRNHVTTTLTLVSQGNGLHVKPLNPPEWFGNSVTINFLRIHNTRSEAADLILRSQTFNISPKLGRDKFVLCSDNIEDFIYVILFPDESTANAFWSSVLPHVDHRIACNYDWITPFHLLQIDAPESRGYRSSGYSRR